MNSKSDPYTLTLGKVTMVIDAAKGARITSLKYESQEVLSQIAAPNMFGSTFWTSPQKVWNWPPVREHDIMPYSVEQSNGALVMTSQLSQKIPLRITKSFCTDKKEKCFIITYTIKNESGKNWNVAPWEITRVPAEGNIYFDAKLEEITPAGLMDFKNSNGILSYTIDQRDFQRKINADGKGWLAFTCNNLLLLKRFPDLSASESALGEAEIQVYIHQGKAYVELENQGAYTTLKPGDATSWTVRWHLISMKDLKKNKRIKKLLHF